MKRAALAALMLAAAAACNPGARGRCAASSECRRGSYCSAGGICLADPGPSVTVFVPPAADAVNGWVPRTGGTLEVRATVGTVDGAAAQDASLSLDSCPPSAPCSYPGTVVSQAAGSTEFSFQVPRAAQAAGSEAPVGFTVKATDAAGSEAQGAGALQIDDAPPQIGAFTSVSRGAAGEDGKSWFLGGSGAQPVEIAVPVADSGAGFASLTLLVDSTDVIAGTTLAVPGSPGGDGTVHFQLPASGVRGKEEHLRFTLTATDQLQHAASLGPDDPRTMIWVDAVAPTLLSAPRVEYATAAGPGPQCAAESGTYNCGRQGGSHLLPDDTATVSFDAYDCGAGLGAAQPDASISTNAGGAHTSAVTGTVQGAAQCANGSTNPLHHYSFTLNLAALALALDPPDPSGTTQIQLATNVLDRLQQGTAGNAAALVSLWRWRSLLTTNAQPAGSPALIPGPAGSRQIAVGTTLSGGQANLFVLNPDGSRAWFAQVASGIGADVATGPSGAVYAISPAGSCGVSCTGTLNIIAPPASGSGLAPSNACDVKTVSFGTAPVILSSPEIAVAATTARAAGSTSNVFFFDPSKCPPASATVGTSDYAGVSASLPTVFFASGQGFSSEDLMSGSNSFIPGSLRIYNAGTSSVPALAPPSIAAESTMSAIFGTAAPDRTVRRTVKSSNCGVPCWQTDSSFVPQQANSGLPFTPVFDGNNIYIADDAGRAYAYPRATGGASLWKANFRDPLPPPWPTASTSTISPPVLLQDAQSASTQVLEVRSDGLVALVSSSGAIVPLLLAAPLNNPVAPAIDTRGANGGVAYVSDGQGWVWALQLALAPAPAGPSVWPRPGRDSCNSRNAASTCQ